MNERDAFETVAVTSPTDFGKLPDEVLLKAASFITGEALVALMLGVEIGVREAHRGEDTSLLTALLERMS